MTSTFTTTGATAHSTTVTGLTNGGSYSFFVRCQDAAANPNTNDFTISFSVAQPADVGLVAAYSFNEGTGTTVADASGRGHTGTISGATWSTQGRFGNALSFDGVNDMVTVNSTALLGLTTGMTLEAWVFPTAQGALWRNVIIKERAGGEVYNLYSNIDTAKPTVYVVRASAPTAPLDAPGSCPAPRQHVEPSGRDVRRHHAASVRQRRAGGQPRRQRRAADLDGRPADRRQQYLG